MKNKTFLLVLFAAFSLSMSAQITGTVLEASTDFPVIGASVVEVGTTNGVITDFDGNFELNVAEGTQIQISYMGFAAQTLAAKNGMIVRLAEDTHVLQEVVAIGYGSQTKKEITGSVSSVKAEDFNQGVAANPMGLIQGKVAGLSIVKTSGDDPANNKYNVQLRGVGSLKGDATPLYVIDGVPGGDLSSVLPSDIESIDVLKDASSTAIYGAAGANGVVIITTKNPSKDKFSINLDAYYGWNVPSKFPEIEIDLTFNADISAVKFDKIKMAAAAASELLDEVVVKDIYFSEDGSCALTLRFSFVSADRTLTKQELAPVTEAVANALVSEGLTIKE